MRQIASSTENISKLYSYLDLHDLYINFNCCLILHCICNLQLIYPPAEEILSCFCPGGTDVVL